MRRHGRLELLLVLPDGSKSLIPAAWTDTSGDAHADGDFGRDGDADGDEVATLGSLAELLVACVLVADLAHARVEQEGQAARKSPSKEDSDAACPALFDTRPGTETSGATTGEAGRTSTGRGGLGGDHAVGRCDRQSERSGRGRGARR